MALQFQKLLFVWKFKRMCTHKGKSPNDHFWVPWKNIIQEAHMVHATVSCFKFLFSTSLAELIWHCSNIFRPFHCLVFSNNKMSRATKLIPSNWLHGRGTSSRLRLQHDDTEQFYNENWILLDTTTRTDYQIIHIIRGLMELLSETRHMLYEILLLFYKSRACIRPLGSHDILYKICRIWHIGGLLQWGFYYNLKTRCQIELKLINFFLPLPSVILGYMFRTRNHRKVLETLNYVTLYVCKLWSDNLQYYHEPI